jgi:hypothetical protein
MASFSHQQVSAISLIPGSCANRAQSGGPAASEGALDARPRSMVAVTSGSEGTMGREVETGAGSTQGGITIRQGAERYLLLVIVSFVVAVVGTRWFLQATGYPQVGGGELHVAHMLWGGLALLLAALLPLVLSSGRALTVSAILAGAGTGLFIDEVGKFITASNDYFYPLAAPLIYGVLLALVLLFVILRRRPDARPAAVQPGRLAAWEAAHLPRRRHRRILVALLGILGLAWLATLVVFVAVDPATVREAIEAAVNVPGDRVERPDDPVFYGLEAAILGAGGILLLLAAVLLGTGREPAGTRLATVGIVVALTAGALVSLYVEQVSAISSTLYHAALLFGVLHYRNRFLEPGDAARPATA